VAETVTTVVFNLGYLPGGNHDLTTESTETLKALDAARHRVNQSGWTERVEFHRASHARITEYAAAETVTAVVFNLGYLPGGDHDLTTESAETLKALEAAASVLKPGGTLSVICYPGHPQGALEALAVENWAIARSGSQWRMAKYQLHGTQRPAPFLVLLGKNAMVFSFD
jgi:hypothetical protein